MMAEKAQQQAGRRERGLAHHHFVHTEKEEWEQEVGSGYTPKTSSIHTVTYSSSEALLPKVP